MNFTRLSVRYILLRVILCVTTALGIGELSLHASEPLRPINSSYMVSVGSSHLGDTYLSAVKYAGWSTAFNYERTQAMKFAPEQWRQQLMLGVRFDSAENPARNANMYYASLHASWGMLHRWQLPYNLAVAFGGSAGGNFGATYSQRNSNNPASAKVDITVNLAAYATWKTRVSRLPVMLMWQTSLPLTGVFFSQEYDELYYEIYLGNHSGLVHWAWPGNMFRWNNLVCADLDFGNTRLRLGFRSDIYSTQVNNLTTRIFNYAFVLGVTGDWFSIKPHRGLPSETTQIIYAY